MLGTSRFCTAHPRFEGLNWRQYLMEHIKIFAIKIDVIICDNGLLLGIRRLHPQGLINGVDSPGTDLAAILPFLVCFDL